MGQMAVGGRSGACPPAAICPPFEVRMLASIVVRTKIAKFGPGQFNFVLAKTEIAVFGPGQHHPARGGERFRRFFARARAPASTGTRKCYYFDRPRAGSSSQEATAAKDVFAMIRGCGGNLGAIRRPAVPGTLRQQSRRGRKGRGGF